MPESFPNTMQQEILEKTEGNYESMPDGVIAVNCGDGRKPVPDDIELYGKKFGGRLGFTWDYMVLRELTNPGSVQETWVEADSKMTPLFEKAEIQADVHSDEHAEGEGATLIAEVGDNTGCGRVKKGKEIALTFFEKVEDIITEMHQIAPSLIDGNEDTVRQLAAANKALATRTLADGRPVIPPGREAMLGSIKNGARGVVLAGDHAEEDGAVYNLKKRTTNNTYNSQRQYDADGWITQQLYDANQNAYPVDETTVLLQDVAISLATKWVLTGDMSKVAVRA